MKYQSYKPVFIMIVFFSISIFCGCKSIYKSGFVQPPDQPISGSIEIGPEWVEIVPPNHLIPYGSNQYVSLECGIYNEKKRVDRELEILYLGDGRETKLEAFLFAKNETNYELKLVGTWGNLILEARKGEVKWDGEPNFSHPDYSDVKFPTDQEYTKLKIRSDIKLKCEFIEWTGTNPK